MISALTCGCRALAGLGPQDEPGYLSHRSAFGWDTATLEGDEWEVQFGTGYDPRDQHTTTLLTLRASGGESTELYADIEPYSYGSRDGEDGSGIGDLIFGVRHRFLDQRASWPSAAAQFQVKLPTGEESEALSSGETDFFAAAMLTQEYGNFTSTLFYELGWIEQPDGGDELLHAAALGTELALSRRWGGYGQLVTVQPEVDDELLILSTGLSWNVTGSAALDLGVAFGLNDETPDTELFFGITWGGGGDVIHRHAPGD